MRCSKSKSAVVPIINRDAVRPFAETKRGRMFSLLLQMENFAGILSATIEAIANSGARIVNLHQNMAIKGLSTVLVTLDDALMKDTKAELLTRLRRVHGIRTITIMDK